MLLQGNVEAWLGLLLERVRKTLHSIIRQAYLAISDPGLKLLEFQAVFPAQVGLLGLQMIWTKDSEEALGLSKADKKVCSLVKIDSLNMEAANTVYSILTLFCSKTDKKVQFII